jgi:hypothetical protein
VDGIDRGLAGDPMMKRLLLALAALAIALAGCVGAANATNTDTQYPTEIANQISTVSSNLQTFQANAYDGNGRWDPTYYSGSQGDGWWEKEQWPAISEAALSRVSTNNLAAAERTVATATVNQAIATHTLSNGNFDGPAGQQSGVGGTQWAQAEAIIAMLLINGPSPPDLATRTSWEQSLVKYTNYSESGGNATWYINGNVNLNILVAMLGAYKLAQNIGNSADASAMLTDYQNEQKFIMNPPGWNPASWGPVPYGNGPGFGWHQVGSQGWFSETPNGSAGSFVCNNNQTPCEGLDWEYTTAQESTANWGYVLSGRDPWWQNIVTSEAAIEQTRLVDGGTLNGSGGSRHNTPSMLFNPDVFSIMANNNLGGPWDTLWGQQQPAMANRFAYDNSQTASSLYVNEYCWLATYSAGIADHVLP